MDNQPLPSSTPISSPITSIPQPPQSHTPKIIIISLITFLLGGIAVYLWQNPQILSSLPFMPQPVSCTFEAKICPDGSSVGRVPPNCDFSPCPETINQTKTTSTETSLTIPTDWETYTNEMFNYNFKYPSSWYIYEDSATESRKEKQNVYISARNIVNGPCKDGTCDFSETIIINAEDSFDISKVDLNKNQIKEVKINNLSATKVTTTSDKELVGNPTTTYYIKKNNRFLSISFENNDLKENHNSVFDQILSTFKFIDQTSTIPPDWKTYNNNTYKYQIKYPPTWTLISPNNQSETTSLSSIRENSNIYPFHDLSIQSFPNGDIKTFQNSTTNWQWFETPKSEETIIANTNSWIIEGKMKGSDDKLYWRKYILVPGKQTLYEISWFDDINQSSQSILNQILSTFKFLN